MAEAASLKVSVWRGGEHGEFARFEVPARANQTVLDVVTYIQRELDPSLAYRFACRVGMCGSCAMTVNGVLHAKVTPEKFDALLADAAAHTPEAA